MAYIGTVGGKITARVTLVNIYEYVDHSFSYYGTTKYIYTMKDEAGNILVWKSSSFMSVPVEETKDNQGWHPIRNGDVIDIKATVKGHDTYKDTEQTTLTRVTIKGLVSIKQTEEELESAKKAAQLESLRAGDQVITMPYRNYKEHYSDCETVAGSFENRGERSVIDVIIRNGRMKPSGVRGKHFHGYQFKNETGGIVCFRAVCSENALNRANKEMPGHTWTLDRIYE